MKIIMKLKFRYDLVPMIQITSADNGVDHGMPPNRAPFY